MGGVIIAAMRWATNRGGHHHAVRSRLQQFFICVALAGTCDDLQVAVQFRAVSVIKTFSASLGSAVTSDRADQRPLESTRLPELRRRSHAKHGRSSVPATAAGCYRRGHNRSPGG